MVFFFSFVSIRRIITTVPGRNVLTFITGEMLVSSCFGMKVSVMLMRELTTQIGFALTNLSHSQFSL